MEETVYSELDTVSITDLLMGRTVKKIADDTLELDNGTKLLLVGNEGCGGCGAGDYDLTDLNGCDNVITRVEYANNLGCDDMDDSVYEIFVYADHERINLARFEGTEDNGYYGTGYTIHVRAMNP